jgi:HSP20 family protein
MYTRRFPGYSMWAELDSLQREMNRLFDNSFSYRRISAPTFPAMNIWTNDEGALVTAEIPGVDIKDIEISVVGESLTLSGERKPEAVNENEVVHRQERGFGKFTRTVELPFPVDANKVDAVFDKGVLKINLPRAEEDKPRKIAIKAG